MKVGEIKIQSLLLIYPDASVKFDETDDESINNAIFELKSDGNFGGVIEASVGAINRAFSFLESKGLSLTKCKDILSKDVSLIDNSYAKIPLDSQVLYIKELLVRKNGRVRNADYEKIGDFIVTDYVRNATYILVYKTKIPRIKSTGDDSQEIILPNGVCEIIPYFVKADLIRWENEGASRESMDIFEKRAMALSQTEEDCQGCVLSVYTE